MKKVLLFSAFLVSCSGFYAQVSDIGIEFKKKGFIRTIDYASRTAIVNFVGNQEISSEPLEIPVGCAFNLSKAGSQLADLHPGMSITIEGDYFRKKGNSVAKKIAQNKDFDEKFKIENGRIEKIGIDFAVVDGKKIKLKKGTKIKGVNGYKKTFESVAELLLGDIVTVNGYYDRSEGCIYANSFEVEPDVESEHDVTAKSSTAELHAAIYPIWIDKAARKEKLLGQKSQWGTIVKNEVLQDYIQALGMKLVPDYLKAADTKIKFMFMVVDNPEPNACVFPTGLSIVNMGLFNVVENEAQLAAVLGHEIAHAIYEHGAKRINDLNKAEKKAGLFKRAQQMIENVILPHTPAITVNSPLGQNQKIKINNAVVSPLLTDLTISAMAKKLSNYSMEEEAQADRVGLSLLVYAGYDPREAPMVWANFFKFFPNAPLKHDSFLDNSINDIKKTNTRTASGLAIEIIKSVARTRNNNNYIEAQRTHPENLKRFENLNEMIDLFWASDDLIRKSTKGEDSWASTWQKVFDSDKKAKSLHS